MLRKVKITKLPKAAKGHAGNGYVNSVPEQVSNWGGADVSEWQMPDMSTKRTLQPVPRSEANIEAEKGEVAYGDINGDMFAETYLIGGQRHSNGGTPLNVPEGTFIFSDFSKMKLKDPKVLAFFGKTTAKGKSMKKGGYTPAELAKQYDINKYRAILEDPNSDKHDRTTAELMIKEYQMKLGGLALAQEAKKNYEQGIPEVAMPFMQMMGIEEEDIIKNAPQAEPPQMARYGGFLPSYQTYGQVYPDAQTAPGTGAEAAYRPKFNPSVAATTRFLRDFGLAEELHQRPSQKVSYVGEPTPVESVPADDTERFLAYQQSLGGPEEVRPTTYKGKPIIYSGTGAGAGTMGGPTHYRRQIGGEQAFTPHTMYHPETGEGIMTNVYDEHLELDDQGYVHERPVMKRGGQLPKYQTGDEVKNYLENIDRYEGKFGDLETSWGGSEKHAQVYQSLLAELVSKDENGNTVISPFGMEIVNQTKKALLEQERYKGKRTSSKMWEDLYGKGSVEELTPKEILDAFVLHQRRNLKLDAIGAKAIYYKDSNGQLKTVAQLTQTINPATKKQFTKEEAEALHKDLTNKGYTSINKVSKDIGESLGDSRESRLEQATFHGYDRMVKHKDEIQDPDLKARVDYWSGDLQSGEADEPGEGKRRQISPIDAIYTNTTAGHLVGLRGPAPEPEETTEETDTDVDVDVDVTETTPYQQPPTGPWAQDVLDLYGAVVDKSKLKDYYPWAPDINRQEIELPRVDPTRELAALSEQTGMVARGLQGISGGGPEMAARLSGINRAGDIANVINRYNLQNVDLEAKEELTQAELDARYANQKAAIDSDIYDKTIATLAASDYADAVGSQRIRDAYKKMKTHQMQTAALNTLYPDYNIDPTNWGEVIHTPQPKTPTPNRSEDFKDQFTYWKTQGMSDKDAIAAAKISSGATSGGYMGPDLEGLMNMYNAVGSAQQGGFVMGSNVFPFMFY